MKQSLLVGVVVAGTLALATSAMAAEADISYSYVELNHESTSVDIGQFECWSECPGDQEPAGWNLAASFEIITNLFIRGSFIRAEDEEDHYGSDISSEWDQLSLGVGYAMDISNSTSAYAALDFTQNEFTYEWKGPNTWKYSGQDANVVSVTVGSRSKITDSLEFDASLGLGNHGFRQTELALLNHITDKLSIKAALSNAKYALEEGKLTTNGVPNPNWNIGDDVDADVQTFSLGVRYDI